MSLKRLYFLIVTLVFAGAQVGESAESRIKWPPQSLSLTTNHTPIIVDGVVQGFLGTTFHIESFDPVTTVLRGFIETTNKTDFTNTVRLCVHADAICYHIEILNMKGDIIRDPKGGLYNWIADNLTYEPHECKIFGFKIRLKDYYDLKPGPFQLLFVFDERMLRTAGRNEHPRIAWSRQRIILKCVE